MANSTQSDNYIISKITALTDIIRNLKNCMDTNGGNRGGKQQSRGKGTKNCQRKTGKYCWIHGNGGHDGNSCKNEYYTMAEASGAAATYIQLIDIGLIIITNANIFGSDIRK